LLGEDQADVDPPRTRLQHINSRANGWAVGGTLDIESAPGNGTRMRGSVPSADT
jgi:signal transduction histidine kinase